MSAMLSYWIVTISSITPQSEQISTAQSTHWYLSGRSWILHFLYCSLGMCLTCCVSFCLPAVALKWGGCNLQVPVWIVRSSDTGDAWRDSQWCTCRSRSPNSSGTSWDRDSWNCIWCRLICPFQIIINPFRRSYGHGIHTTRMESFLWEENSCDTLLIFFKRYRTIKYCSLSLRKEAP